MDRVSDPSDRRVVICQLSESGEQAVELFWRIGRERLQIVADLLDEEQLETVVQGLEYVRWAEDEIQKTITSMQTTS